MNYRRRDRRVGGRHKASAVPRPRSLSHREVEVLQLLAHGHSSRAISEILLLSKNTVRNHVYAIAGKLSCHSKHELVAEGYRRGLIAPPSPG